MVFSRKDVLGGGGIMVSGVLRRASFHFNCEMFDLHVDFRSALLWRSQSGTVLGLEFWCRITSITRILDLPSHILESIVRQASGDLEANAQSISTTCRAFHRAFDRIRSSPERVAGMLIDRYGPLAPSCLYLKSRGQRLLRGIPGDEGSNARAVLACLVGQLGGFGSPQINTQFPWLLRSATLDGHDAVVEYLLTEGGADPNADGCRNLMSLAVESGHTQVLCLLVAAGADAVGLGVPPLAHAARLGCEEMVDVLLGAGAPVHPVALGLACWIGNTGIARKLMMRSLSGLPVEDARRRLHVAILIAASAGQAQVLGMLRGELRRLPAAADRTWEHLEWYAVTAAAAFFSRAALVDHLMGRLWDDIAAARQLRSRGTSGSHAAAVVAPAAAAAGGGGCGGSRHWGLWRRAAKHLLRSTVTWLVVAPVALIAPRRETVRLLVWRCPLQMAAVAAATVGFWRAHPFGAAWLAFFYANALAHVWVPQDWPYRHHMSVLEQLTPRR